MKITFVGLSCFLLESQNGDSLLIDPFSDQPEYYLGLKFPKNLQADLFLVSHPDEDHSYLKSKFIKKRRVEDLKDTQKATKAFPDLNLRGTIVREYNGDLNLAFSFSIDQIRFLHLADNAHLLNQKQLEEIGRIDVLFISPPKSGIGNGPQTHVKNIKLLNPKLAFPCHYIPPKTKKEVPSREVVQNHLRKKLLQSWVTNPAANEKSVQVLSEVFLQALKLKDFFPNYQNLWSSTFEIEKKSLPQKTRVLVFRECLGS
ncbi:MBL fold metallo-hydrolase [Patescibacteria group bacterium]